MRAVGDQAELINAALPFSDGPIEIARPFVISGTDVDKGLALTCLTQAVFYEAGSEPVEGQRAVAQAVLNRVRHPAFPKSVCGVVYQGAGSGACQFSFVCKGRVGRFPQSDAWRRAEAIARAALSGYVEVSVGEATHYHADYVMPRWAPMLAKVVSIGQHIFYRWPGEWGEASSFSGRYAGEPHDALTVRLAQTTLEALKGGPTATQAAASPRISYHIKGLLEVDGNEDTNTKASVTQEASSPSFPVSAAANVGAS